MSLVIRRYEMLYRPLLWGEGRKIFLSHRGVTEKNGLIDKWQNGPRMPGCWFIAMLWLFFNFWPLMSPCPRGIISKQESRAMFKLPFYLLYSLRPTHGETTWRYTNLYYPDRSTYCSTQVVHLNNASIDAYHLQHPILFYTDRIFQPPWTNTYYLLHPLLFYTDRIHKCFLNL